MPYNGLSDREVKERCKKGLVNGDIIVKTKSYKQILFTNIFTLFNFVNLALAIGLFLVHSEKNSMFMIVVFSNMAIGIIQECRAKKIVDKLSIIAAPTAKIIRNGKEVVLHSADIVLDDVYILENGNQVCSDSIVLDGNCEVNESLLSGETEPVYKKKGDEILSGSYIVSGRVYSQVIHVGEDNYVNAITRNAKYLKRTNSEIYNSVKKLVKLVTFSIAPVYAIMFLKQLFLDEASLRDAIVGTTASVIGMIPSGLILLVSIVMAVSVVRLARYNTLVQDMYSIETLARVDVLCLDKTGTITEGKMSIDEIIPLTDSMSEADIDKAIGEYVYNATENNATFAALMDRYNDFCSEWKADRIVSFSSERKHGLIEFDNGQTYLLGACEYILDSIDNNLQELIVKKATEGKRLVLYAREENEVRYPVALIVMSDIVRKNANSTLDYFANQDVMVKIISGDNPIMVSHVAKRAGVKDYDRYVDATTLDTDEKIKEALDNYAVFGRVTPEQKCKIVKILQAEGHTVGMTGDGVNDVLALKEADCSIAMQAGSEAARNVSNFVLLDSDFSSLPLILNEGRRNINNLERSASLFLTKTSYSILLALAFMFLPIEYPFEPIQLTLVSAFAIGIPSFLLNIEKNESIVEKHFLKRVLGTAIPAGITVLLAVMSAEIFGYVVRANVNEIETLAVYALAVSSIIELFRICRPLNHFRRTLVATLTVTFSLVATIFHSFFTLKYMSKRMLIFVISALIIIFLIRNLYYKKKSGKINKNNKNNINQ